MVIRRRVVPSVSSLIMVFCSGCLTVHRPLALQQSMDQRPAVAASVQITAHPEHLSEIESVDDDVVVEPDVESEQIEMDLKIASDDIREAVARHLNGDLGAAIQWPEDENRETVLPSAGPPFHLEITLSGYGRLKRKWIGYMLATGAVEAVFQGVLVASALHSTWTGVAVGLEEIGSEWVTWHGGAWLFSRTFSPVTLEGRLWYGSSERYAWRKTVFVSRNKDELDKLPEADQQLRQVRLQANLHKAEDLLLADLTTYLQKQGINSVSTVSSPLQQR